MVVSLVIVCVFKQHNKIRQNIKKVAKESKSNIILIYLIYHLSYHQHLYSLYLVSEALAPHYQLHSFFQNVFTP